MSAIFGIIGMNQESLKDYSKKWKAYYDKFKIDRNEQVVTQSAFFGCGIQYFNKEAEREALPIYDKEKNILFTADCVIDNRDELIEELGLSKDTPDGTILYKAFLKWGPDCCKNLRGPFAFAAYNEKTREVVLATDHFSQRCLFYHVRDGILYFSTLFTPILKGAGLFFEENERWLVDTLSLRAPVMMTEPKETAVIGVYKVVSGTYVKINLDKAEANSQGQENRYYDPNKTIKTNKKITKEESELMVREVWENVISRILRDDIEIAAQLSAGLDSSSVTCQAAKLLAPQGRKIYSFTSIPLKEAGLENKGYIVYDESEGVKKIVEAYPNIIPTFVDTKDRNYILEAEDIINLWELPCKSQQNAIWVDEIYRLASQKNCKILLNGGTGNCTLSAGNIESTVVDHFKHFQFKKAVKTMDAISFVGASKKRYTKAILKAYLKYYKWYFDREARDCYSDIVTNKTIGEKYDLTRRFHKNYCHFKPASDMKRMRFEMYMSNANAQIGEIDTKNSLTYGLITRDPTRSVELIDLCFSLPMECFASYDYDRRLAREGMAGIVPEEIRHDVAHRGRQSGDNLFRAKMEWKEFEKRLSKSLDDESDDKYYNKSYVENCFNTITEDEIEESDTALMLIDTYSFNLYLKFLHKEEI